MYLHFDVVRISLMLLLSKDPWGIGPKDYIEDDKKFSYVQLDRILGITSLNN
jgi:hypothetical protein